MKKSKICWIEKILKGYDTKCYTLLHSICNNIDTMFNFGKVHTMNMAVKIKNAFWKDVLLSYSDYLHAYTYTSDTVLDMLLFY